MAKDHSDAAILARARAIAAEEEALQEQYAEHKRQSAITNYFRRCGAAEVLRMYERGINEKGEPLSQFEAEALVEQWCFVFGELPPMGGPPPDAPEPDPLPSDDAMLRIKDVVRITGLSRSTIKRRVRDPASNFPKPVTRDGGRLIGWRADAVKAWRKRIENRRSG